MILRFLIDLCILILKLKNTKKLKRQKMKKVNDAWLIIKIDNSENDVIVSLRGHKIIGREVDTSFK